MKIPKFEEFKIIYGFGMDSYISGNWQNAKKFFKKALQIIPDDKPTQILY